MSRYCEPCGYAFTTGETGPLSAAAEGSWSVVVAADRDYFERTAPDGIVFPELAPSHTFMLDTPEVTIGRRSVARGIAPTIDLTSEPQDPGVSHLHVVLARSTDGAYSVIDRGSLNGTTINDTTAPIEVDHPVSLDDGDMIHIGAWTTITVHAPATTP